MPMIATTAQKMISVVVPAEREEDALLGSHGALGKKPRGFWQ